MEHTTIRKYGSISEMKLHNAKIGNHYFSSDAINAFGAKFESGVIRDVYVIESVDNHSGNRVYKLLMCLNGKIVVLKRFDNLRSAREYIDKLPTYFAEAFHYFMSVNDEVFLIQALIEPENSRDKDSIEYSPDTFCGACTYLMIHAKEFDFFLIKQASKKFYKQLKTLEE
jgi:hypothetical protein